ncbi:hypothetical protein CWI37_0016p0020 [Hamiltosporidium tvaerminnensis]|uniref:Uncharacterized protein n=1 Tax=Hamiltosporidium tvaerminnensis TaxID=1176355 RepID=A0A4Q9LCB5_9MICR|nr:hypothetical protein CWI37_0016p0020 [Hamiltosporidium tvaerminnensis]
MRISYSKESLLTLPLCSNLYFILVICKNVIFYSIENTDMKIDYVENEGIYGFEFKIESKYISSTFKSVYLLQNQYLKCVYINNSCKYYIPNILEISESENIITDLSTLDHEQENILTRRIFIGQISNRFLFRFRKYCTEEDAFINTLSFMELINILTVLEILGFKRTNNNNTFFKYLLLSSIMSKNFDYQISNTHLKLLETNIDILRLLLEYLFSVFSKFIYIEKMKNSTFLSLRSNSLAHDCKIILSFQFYLFYKEKLFNNNTFILAPERILHIEKVLSLAFTKDCICFFIKYCHIDTFWIRTAEKALSKKIFDLIYSIKPKKLRKLVIADNLFDKKILKEIMNNAYFDITETLKVKSDLNLEEIQIILDHCKNLKRLVIECTIANYDVLVLLNEFAFNHQNIFLKYKCADFQIECERNIFLKNIPNNLLFYVQKFHESFLHCEACYSISYGLFRRIITKLDKNFSLEEHKRKFSICLNTKEVYISTIQDRFLEILRPTFFKYIFKMPNLESMIIENIIFTEILTSYILQSKKLIYLKLNNSSISFDSYSRCKIDNYVLRGLTITNSIFTFNIDFINFLLLFHNLSFLKICINDIDESFESLINECTCTYECFKARQEKMDSKLDYFKITIDKNITKGLPMIFALSHFFNFSSLSVLALEIYELDEKDAIVISNLKLLRKVHIRIYLQKTEIFLKRLTIILVNNMIKWIGLYFNSLDIMIFKYLVSLKSIGYIFINFKSLDENDLNLLNKARQLNYDMLVMESLGQQKGIIRNELNVFYVPRYFQTAIATHQSY